jgi:hypothetical protein
MTCQSGPAMAVNDVKTAAKPTAERMTFFMVMLQ